MGVGSNFIGKVCCNSCDDSDVLLADLQGTCKSRLSPAFTMHENVQHKAFSLSLSLDYERTISMLICSTTANCRYSNTKILMHTFFQYYVHILHSRFHRGHHHCHPRKVTWNIWTKLVPTGNTETGCNQWRHCWAKIVLFTYVRHYSWNAFVLFEMRVFLKFIILWVGSVPPQIIPPSFFKIKFQFRNRKFYSANQCVPKRHKSKHWSEWARFEESWYELEYKAPLISIGTNFLHSSQAK